MMASISPEEEIAQLKTKLVAAEGELTKWSARVEAAIDAGNESLKAEVKEREAIAIRRVEALEGQIKEEKDRLHKSKFLNFSSPFTLA